MEESGRAQAKAGGGGGDASKKGKRAAGGGVGGGDGQRGKAAEGKDMSLPARAEALGIDVSKIRIPNNPGPEAKYVKAQDGTWEISLEILERHAPDGWEDGDEGRDHKRRRSGGSNLFQGIAHALGSGVGAIIDSLQKTFQFSRAASGAFERNASEERQKEREDLELDRRIEDVSKALIDVESACNRAVDDSAARVVAAIGMDPAAGSSSSSSSRKRRLNVHDNQPFYTSIPDDYDLKQSLSSDEYDGLRRQCCLNRLRMLSCRSTPQRIKSVAACIKDGHFDIEHLRSIQDPMLTAARDDVIHALETGADM